LVLTGIIPMLYNSYDYIPIIKQAIRIQAIAEWRHISQPCRNLPCVQTKWEVLPTLAQSSRWRTQTQQGILVLWLVTKLLAVHGHNKITINTSINTHIYTYWAVWANYALMSSLRSNSGYFKGALVYVANMNPCEKVWFQNATEQQIIWLYPFSTLQIELYITLQDKNYKGKYATYILMMVVSEPTTNNET
jgi:hypothetical protein